MIPTQITLASDTYQNTDYRYDSQLSCNYSSVSVSYHAAQCEYAENLKRQLAPELVSSASRNIALSHSSQCHPLQTMTHTEISIRRHEKQGWGNANESQQTQNIFQILLTCLARVRLPQGQAITAAHSQKIKPSLKLILQVCYDDLQQNKKHKNLKNFSRFNYNSALGITKSEFNPL